VKNLWIELAVTVIVNLVPIVIGLLGLLIVQAIKNSKTQSDDRLAAIAVSWAEDFYGAGSGNKKLKAASDKLSELTKGKVSPEQAEIHVRAAYQKLMGALAPLKK
jgi:Tfp pilus assembly protein PilV